MAREETFLLGIADLAAIFGVSERKMHQMVKAAGFPSPVKPDGVKAKTVRWRRDEVFVYINSLPRG